MMTAERLVQELMLVSVVVAGDGADVLARALAQAGAEAEVLRGTQVPGGFDLAILLTQGADAETPHTRELVELLSRASERLLLAPLPLGAAPGGDGGALPELPQWFELLAERGFQPVVDFDASFVSPGAFLVDRAAIADEADLAAMTERLQLGPEAAGAQRAAVAEAERNVRTELQAAREALAARETALAQAQSALVAARAESADLMLRATSLAEAAQAAQTALAQAEQRNEGWDGLRGWVRLDVANPARNTRAALIGDLDRINALRAPNLQPVRLPEAVRRSWIGRLVRRAAPQPRLVVLEQAALVRASPHFDAAWYVAAHADAFLEAAIDPAFHYVLVGGPLGLDPGPYFDAGAYVSAHPEAEGSALLHAIAEGN